MALGHPVHAVVPRASGQPLKKGLDADDVGGRKHASGIFVEITPSCQRHPRSQVHVASGDIAGMYDDARQVQLSMHMWVVIR